MIKFPKYLFLNIDKNKQNKLPYLYIKDFFEIKTLKFQISSEHIHLLTFKIINQIINQIIKNKTCSLFSNSEINFFFQNELLFKIKSVMNLIFLDEFDKPSTLPSSTPNSVQNQVTTPDLFFAHLYFF